MNGKGDKRRPEDRAKIDANWDKIFKSGSKMAENPIAVNKGKSDRDFSVYQKANFPVRRETRIVSKWERFFVVVMMVLIGIAAIDWIGVNYHALLALFEMLIGVIIGMTIFYKKSGDRYKK